MYEGNFGDYPTDAMVKEQATRDDVLLASGKATGRDVCVIYGIRYSPVAAWVSLATTMGFNEATEKALIACGHRSLAKEPVLGQLAAAFARDFAREGRE